jgi:hypothetical protein
MKKKYSYSKKDNNIYQLKTTDFKTTNINILLNRVRETKKHNAKKKILSTIVLVALITSIYLIFF